MTADESHDHHPDQDPRIVALLEAAFRVVEQRLDSEGPTRAGLLPFSWLTPQEVAEEAGMEVEVFEELWPAMRTPEGTRLCAFECFLVEAFGTYRGPTVSESTAWAYKANRDDLDEMIRVSALGHEMDDDRLLQQLMATAMSAFSQRERLDYVDRLDEMANLLQHLVYSFGLRMKPPLTIQHLVMNLAAVIDGRWIQESFGIKGSNRAVEFRMTPLSQPAEWTLSAIAACAVLRGMTEPMD